MTTTAQNIVDALLLGFQHLDHPAVQAAYERLLLQLDLHYNPSADADLRETLRYEVVREALNAFRANPLSNANRLVNELHDLSDDLEVQKAVINLSHAVERAVSAQTPPAPSPSVAPAAPSAPQAPPASAAPPAPSVEQAPAPQAPQPAKSAEPPPRSGRGLGGLFNRSPRPEKKEEQPSRSDRDAADRARAAGEGPQQPDVPDQAQPAPAPGTPPTPSDTGEYALDLLDDEFSEADTEVLSPSVGADEPMAVEKEASQTFMPGPPILASVSEEQASEAQFSAYYPPQVNPGVNYGLYVYAHTPDALQAIRENVARFKDRLGGDIPDATTAARHAMLRNGTELVAVPQAEHVTFNPPQQIRTWIGDWTRFDFDFMADAHAPETLEIRVSIQIAGIEIAHIPCVMQVNATDTSPVRSINPLLDARLRAATARMYSRIFISYSRRDLPVANAYRLAQQAAGNDVFMDSYSIRAGEDWQAALARAIDEADVFQLFWSKNSAESPNVRDEYSYALTQRCPDDRCATFIRPVFWEQPLVPPPSELVHLNFKFVALPDDIREATAQASDSETTLIRLASMESRLSAIEASIEAIKQAVLGQSDPKQ